MTSSSRAPSAAIRPHFAIASSRRSARSGSDIQRRDVQRFADELLGDGLDPSTVRNVLMPLRVIFRRAIEDGDLAVNPTAHLRLPAVRGRRERIASPEEAKRLLAALPARDRAVWATALYAGVALDRLQDVADALGLEIEETATYATTRYRDVDDGEAFEHYADPAHRDPALAIEPRLINSRAENAINAQIFALKVIWLCLHKPKKGLASLTSWCEQ